MSIAALFLYLSAVGSAHAEDRTLYPAQAVATHTAQRHALVIGQGAYTSGPLVQTVPDAIQMAKTLEELGFNVTLATDLNKDTLKAEILNFRAELERIRGNRN